MVSLEVETQIKKSEADCSPTVALFFFFSLNTGKSRLDLPFSPFLPASFPSQHQQEHLQFQILRYKLPQDKLDLSRFIPKKNMEN